MGSAAAAGNEFLRLGWAEPSVPPITQMKLQKLLFYGHAWSLAINGMPLFDEDFEAWPWGPVVRDVYSQTAKFGKQPVSTELVRVQVKNGGFGFVTPRVESESQKEFIKGVWETHKRFTGIQLSNSTHAVGEPWTIVKEQYGSLDNKPTIPNDLIKSVFEAKLARLRTAAAANP